MTTLEIISIKEARASGLKRYFTGKPCRHGHIAERRVRSRKCLKCIAIYKKEERKKKPAKPTEHKGGKQRTPIAERFWPKVDKSENCWEWIGARNSFGRGLLGRGGRYGGHIMAPRASWEIHYGEIPDGLWVLHHCDNPGCVRPDHLFLGTHTDNMRDAKAKGRLRNGRLCGESSPNSKLTKSDVAAIRSDRRSQTKIAREYGIAQTTVSGIKTGKTWREDA